VDPCKSVASFFTNKKGSLAAALSLDCKSGLRRLYVLSLPALGPFDHVELDLLTFLQAAESICLDGGEVHKHILPILAADETITFGVVKPLHCSCFHGVALFLFLFRYALMYSLDFCRQVTPVSGSYWKLQSTVKFKRKHIVTDNFTKML
jgi:hypothetical protein